ncbi:Zinc finger protein 26 [Plakobranchus ocellatus]|uniref:Zinc finger protein 26 n=1 Tax=Plakobranchus ocellatus TaxID=259542 RepID=A0AAV4DG13_9GAST|nr:Zinc finger protein 26 [Plakobranchus ocellatus]
MCAVALYMIRQMSRGYHRGSSSEDSDSCSSEDDSDSCSLTDNSVSRSSAEDSDNSDLSIVTLTSRACSETEKARSLDIPRNLCRENHRSKGTSKIPASVNSPKIASKSFQPCTVCSLLMPCSSTEHQEMIYHTQSLNCKQIAATYTSLMQQNISIFGASLEECAECKAKFSMPALLLKHLYNHAVAKTVSHQTAPPGAVSTKTFERPDQVSKSNDKGLSVTIVPEDLYEISQTKKMKNTCVTQTLTEKESNDPVSQKRKKSRDILCELCGALFSTKSSVRKHIKVVHKKIYCFKCKTCEKSFGSKIQLEIHEGNHKPHVCNICNKAIADKRFFKLHKAAHRNGEKPFKCNQCGKSFMSKIYLREHQAIHSGEGEKPHMCVVCGKGYMSKVAMQRHIQRHTELKDVQCTVCDRKFYNKHELQDHMRSHNSQRSHLCELCRSSFKKPSTLKRHLATVHRLDNKDK